jgi:hypothetical protein
MVSSPGGKKLNALHSMARVTAPTRRRPGGSCPWRGRGGFVGSSLFEWRGALPALVIFALLLSASVAVGFTLRDYSLSSITAFYTPEAAVLSPALLSDDELKAAYRTATADARVHKALQAVGPAKRIVLRSAPGVVPPGPAP